MRFHSNTILFFVSARFLRQGNKYLLPLQIFCFLVQERLEWPSVSMQGMQTDHHEEAEADLLGAQSKW